MQEGVWRKRSLPTRLAGTHAGAATRQNSTAGPQRLRAELPHGPTVPLGLSNQLGLGEKPGGNTTVCRRKH